MHGKWGVMRGLPRMMFALHAAARCLALSACFVLFVQCVSVITDSESHMMAEFGKTNRPRGGAARHWRCQLTLRRRERMLLCCCVLWMQSAACVRVHAFASVCVFVQILSSLLTE